jgi:glycerate 2-kinase
MPLLRGWQVEVSMADRNMLSSALIRFYQEALAAAMPGQLVRGAFSVKSQQLVATDFALPITAKVNVLGFGKASLSMYSAVREMLGARYLGKSLVVTHLPDSPMEDLSADETVVLSSHPYVTHASMEAGEKAMEFVANQGEDDILLVLVSGGGSAMVAMPTEGVSAEAKMDFIARAIRQGVPEREVNVIRKALSKIKGGQLAEHSRARRIVNLVLSDEREHQLSAIASGMTVFNDEIDPIAIMDRYALWPLATTEISTVLRRHGKKVNVAGECAIFNVLVGSREDLVHALKERAPDYGYSSVKLVENLHSVTPASAVDRLWQEFREYSEQVPAGRHLVVATGEVQVKVASGNTGRGGRNQHLTALMMRKPRIVPGDFCFLAVATDGMDFMEGVHGAFFDSEMMPRIEQSQDEIAQAIADTNTYALHQRMNSLVSGGKTGSNLSDFFLFSFTKH